MAVFVIIIILVLVAHQLFNAYILRKERKEWMFGHEYVRSEVDEWVIAKHVDNGDVKFEVRKNPLDGYFYDRDGFGYTETEIKIKRNDSKLD